MKTLTISKATGNLATWLQRAVAGEDIGIRSGETVVALRPMPLASGAANEGRMAPRDALRSLQQDARLTPAPAEAYLNEVRAERLVANAEVATVNQSDFKPFATHGLKLK